MVWVYIGIAVLAALLIAGVVVASIILWRRQVRRSLIGLTGRREALRAAYRALESVFASLAEADENELTDFAVDARSTHRRALAELHVRMRMEADELADIPLPKRLWHAADLLSVAAGCLALETGRVGEASSGEAVLDALALIDVQRISASLEPADAEINRLLEELEIADPAVYGGGMYI